MPNQMQLLIDELGEQLGLPGLKLDDTNSAVISTIDDLDIGFTYAENGATLTLYSQHGTIPHERRDELYATLLKANFGWEQNRGATLSVTERDQVVLQRSLRADLADANSLVRDFTRFYEWASLAATAIRNPASPDSSEPTEAESQHIDPSMFA